MQSAARPEKPEGCVVSASCFHREEEKPDDADNADRIPSESSPNLAREHRTAGETQRIAQPSPGGPEDGHAVARRRLLDVPQDVLAEPVPVRQYVFEGHRGQ